MPHNKNHASEHTDGTDDIQDATGSQKGLMTAAQASKLNDIADEATNYTDADARSAISTEDAYLKNTGDTGSGDYTFDTNTLKIDSSNHRVGIGTTTPTVELQVYGESKIGKGIDPQRQVLDIAGHISFEPISNPTTTMLSNIVLTNAGAGNIPAGTYYYGVMFYSSEGDTGVKGTSYPARPSITSSSNFKVDLSNIPISPDPRVIGRKIYRSQAGTSGDYYYLYHIGTIADNTTTTWTDNTGIDTTADDWLYNKNNKTTGIFYIGTTQGCLIGDYITFFGKGCGGNITKATSSAGFGTLCLSSLTTGGSNAAFGHGAASSLTTGSHNIAMGYAALQGNQTGTGNVALGSYAVRNNNTKSYHYCVGIGYHTLFGLDESNNYNIGLGYQAGNYAQASYGIYIGRRAGFCASATDIGNSNLAIGDLAGRALSTGSKNILIGYAVELASPTSNNQLNIGNVIYATGMTDGSSPSATGKVGIDNNSPAYTLDVDGDINISSGSNYKINGTNIATTDTTYTAGTGLSLTGVSFSVNESAVDHDGLSNTHNLTTDIDHSSITNTHNLTTDINHNSITNSHNLTTDIDHDSIANSHNLTTDIDHDSLTNTHNLTTDIDHNSLANYDSDEHFKLTDVYPVGAIYLSVDSTNPGTLFGGTWTAIGAGRMLVGIDSSDSRFDTVEETGGGTTKDMSHTHNLGNHTHDMTHGHPTVGVGPDPPIVEVYDQPHVGSTGVPSPNTSDSGGSATQDVLNPYLVVYMWKRTA